MRKELSSICLFLLIPGPVFLTGGGCWATAPSTVVEEQGTGQDSVRRPVDVENVRVLLPLIFPAQVRITVEGRRVDGVPLDVQQDRKDNEVIVTITQTYARQGEARLVEFREAVGLDGPFPPGKYTLTVNSYSTAFVI